MVHKDGVLNKKVSSDKIPDQWINTHLNEIIDSFIVPMRDKPQRLDGEVPWCRIEDIEGKYISRSISNQGVNEDTIKEMNLKVIPKGSLIYSCSATLGVGAITQNDIITNQTFIGMVPSERINIEFLYYLLNFHKSRFVKIASGTTIPYISREKFENFRIMIPSIKEQQKIADILTSVDCAISKTEAIIKQTKKVKKGLMQQLLTKGMGHTKFKKSVIGMIPESWSIVELADLADIKSGITKGRKVKDEKMFSAPYLRVANVQDGYLDLQEIKCIDVTSSELERYELLHGDVLLTEGGDADKLGRGCVWKNEIPKCIHQNHVFRVRTDPTKLLPEYLSFLTGSDYGKTYFFKCSKQTTNLASINSSQLKAFPVILPSIDEQQRIINTLNSLKSKVDFERRKQREILVLKQSLMQDLLTGNVRVILENQEAVTT